MQAVAVMLTYGRAAVCEVLAMLERQTRPTPCLLYIDNAAHLATGNLGELVHVVHGPYHEHPRNVAGVRVRAIDEARRKFNLGREDVIVVLDDDDFYSTRHMETTLAPFSDLGVAWTGALRIGLQHGPGEAPELLSADGGPGQHATWAYRLGLYDDAGGYREEDEQDDPGLALRMGWGNVRPHAYLTHVRRHHAMQVSRPALPDGRARIRREDPALTAELAPRWTSECAALELWCAERWARPPDPTVVAQILKDG